MKLVAFDLFNTLVKYQIRHSPYRKLIRYGQSQGRAVRPTDARDILTTNCDLQGIAEYFGINAPPSFLRELEMQLDEELESLSLYEDVKETLESLAELNISIAICSNLAAPYGKAIDNLLSEFSSDTFLSYKLGSIKPDREIYKAISDTMEIPANECLFIGDNFHCDYQGPIEFGFQARHLVRDGNSSEITIRSLKDVPVILESS